MAKKNPKKEVEKSDKDHLRKIKERESHEGPWICDRCGNWARTLENTSTRGGGKKSRYDCGCGGTFWPGK